MLTKADVKRWACKLLEKKPMKRKSWNGIKGVLSGFYDYLEEEGRTDIRNNPTRGLKISSDLFLSDEAPAPGRKDAPPIYTKEEAEQLIQKSVELAYEKKDENYLAIPLLFLTGLRLGEVEALGFDDFDEKSETISVRKSVQVIDEKDTDGNWKTRRYEIKPRLKKNATPRQVYIPPYAFQVSDMVRDILAKKLVVRGQLFNVKTHNNIEKKVSKVCELCGITERSPQKMRRTFSSYMRATWDKKKPCAPLNKRHTGHQTKPG